MGWRRGSLCDPVTKVLLRALLMDMKNLLCPNSLVCILEVKKRRDSFSPQVLEELGPFFLKLSKGNKLYPAG